MKISARNTLSGTIKSIEMGAVNNEVTIELGSDDRTCTRSRIDLCGNESVL